MLVTADDYGIGPETSRAIRELGSLGTVTSTVFLVNSPFAENDIDLWRRGGKPVETGWHPCLTMDRPVLPPERVPSLVDAEGRFFSLGGLLSRLALVRIRTEDLLAELAPSGAVSSPWRAGLPAWSTATNTSTSSRRSVGPAAAAAAAHGPHPPAPRTLAAAGPPPAGRIKRVFLSVLGQWTARRQQAAGLPGNDYPVGVTDPPWVKDPEFFAHRLKMTPGNVVELMVHPGHLDETRLGRDCTRADGQMQRRVDEWACCAIRRSSTSAGPPGSAW